MNAKKPGLEMTASLLKKLLQFEARLEKDHIKTLTKDWNTLYKEGDFYQEELIVTNSFKNSQKTEGNFTYVPKKRSHRKAFGVRWKEQNEIFDIETIKENIEGAMHVGKKDDKMVGKKGGATSASASKAASEEKNHDLITNVNEEDLKERAATAFFDDDENVQPIVIGDTYSELFLAKKGKDRKPIPSLT